MAQKRILVIAVLALLLCLNSGIQAEVETDSETIIQPAMLAGENSSDSYSGEFRQKLRKMNQQKLDKLYSEAEAGPLPDGDCEGYAIWFFNNKAGSRFSRFMQWKAWYIIGFKGKMFTVNDDQQTGTVLDIFHRKPIFLGKVYYGPAVMDGKTSIILDWGEYPFGFTDEIRMVAPGIYLGFSYSRAKKRLLNVVLDCECNDLRWDKLD